MIVQKLKPSRIKNRINVCFDDGSYLPMLIDDVVKLSLKKNKEVDLDVLKKFSQNYLAKEYALRQIAISPKTEKILSQKLRQKFKDFDSEKLLKELHQYLKEENYISYIQNKFKHKSNREITYRLKMAGINFVCQSNDQAKIRQIIAKKPNISISSLISKGFSYPDIKSVFANLSQIK
jgi:SOS response regulatory protein OraA/RecX